LGAAGEIVLKQVQEKIPFKNELTRHAKNIAQSRQHGMLNIHAKRQQKRISF
jgi:hypothetical protein